MLTPDQEKKVEVAYERFRWAAKEAERLFDMPLGAWDGETLKGGWINT